MAAKGAYKRKMYTADRPREDDTRIDRVTTKVRPITVYLGWLDSNDHEPDYRIVLASGFSRRQPRGEVDIFKRLRRELNEFTPTIWMHKKADEELCVCCMSYRKRDKFSPDIRKRNGLDSWCKFCRAERRDVLRQREREAERWILPKAA